MTSDAPTTGLAAGALSPDVEFLPAPPSYSPSCRSAGYTHKEIIRAQTMAALVVGAWGVLLFGPAAASVVAVAILATVASDALIGLAIRRPVIGGLWHAGLTGLLLGLTLPATVSWYVPLIGGVVAICAKTIFGGLGHYACHPALVGRVFVQLFFNAALTLSGPVVQEPVLTRWALFGGSLTNAAEVDMNSYQGWAEVPRSYDRSALKMVRPIRRLRDFAEGQLKPEGNLRYTPLLRDYLPPWEDTVIGAVPGGIGETPSLALLVAGLYLIYRGYLRWQLPVSILIAAAVAASIFPVEGGEATKPYHWFPLFAVENGKAVGLAYVLYHLTSGQLMLGAFLLAGDMTVSPKRAIGQVVFGAAIGIMTIFMRLYGLLEGECYWAILIINFMVPFIDRRMKRQVLGISSE